MVPLSIYSIADRLDQVPRRRSTQLGGLVHQRRGRRHRGMGLATKPTAVYVAGGRGLSRPRPSFIFWTDRF